MRKLFYLILLTLLPIHGEILQLDLTIFGMD